MTEQIDWDYLIIDDNLFDFEAPVLSDLPPVEAFCNPSQDSVPLWIGQTESMLMNDDDQEQQIDLESDQQPISDFLADVLVDSPVDVFNSGEVAVDSPVDVSDDYRNGNPEKENADSSAGKKSNSSDDSGKEIPYQKEINKESEDPNDPLAKKKRRQLRNRDAAVRSRERKKLYLKDLETKSKCLERECMRLERMLQCFVAENQALRLCLQKGGNAYDASAAKQESAVLLWESLLLGSLLWSLGSICLFPRPMPPQASKQENPESMAPRGRGNEISLSPTFVRECFVKSRRCRASRARMKSVFSVASVSAQASFVL